MKVIFPGTFDPFTNGHLDIVKRSLKISSYLYIVVVENKKKSSLFDINSRKKFILKVLEKENIKNCEVITTNDLLVNTCVKLNCFNVIRSVRNTLDFIYEQDFAINNMQINDNIEFILLPAKGNLTHVSSTTVREILAYGGDVSHLVDCCLNLKEEYENIQLKDK